MSYTEIIRKLKLLKNERNIAGMARFGINPKGTLGISVVTLRKIAKEIGKDHVFAQKLWQSKIHEARILAAFVDEPDKVTNEQMERWVHDVDSWDVCDQVCGKLFDRTKFAWKKAIVWAKRPEEFVRRAGFVLMTQLAVHDKKASNEAFEKFFPLIKKYSTDERNFVKKAVNWALRQIGKRNKKLGVKAKECAEEILKLDSKSARWIASDALRELKKKYE